MHPIIRRGAILLAAPALTVTALAATSAPASAAPDPVPAARAADWLEAQLTDGLVHNEQYAFDDLGLSADLAFSLATYGRGDTADTIVAAIAPRAHDEWYTSTFDGVTTLYAGSVAKAAALAQETGADPRAFGGHDLIDMLEGTVATEGATAGRVQDENNEFGDTNGFGQAYAAQVLDAVGSTSTDAVTDFLLAQQCEEGWFRLNYAERDAAEQSCDADPTSVPDTDATAIAVLALMSQADDSDVAAHLAAAEAWLLAEQHPNGAWGGGPTTEGLNANSTGFAGWALFGLGETAAAENAAAWLRAHQVTNVGQCSPYSTADQGAVAYDNATRSALSGGAITVELQDQARRATTQALPLLELAQGAGDTHVLSSPDYVKGGTSTEVGVIGAAPGEALCARLNAPGTGTLRYADVAGEAHLSVRVPARTQTYQVEVSGEDGVIETADVHALGAAKLRVGLKSQRIAGGGKQTITVRGLEPGESASVDIVWPGGGSGTGAGGQANNKGVFKTTIKVPNKQGTAKVKAFGQFKNRKGSTSFTVTR